jgi:hypothetical protein
MMMQRSGGPHAAATRVFSTKTIEESFSAPLMNSSPNIIQLPSQY